MATGRLKLVHANLGPAQFGGKPYRQFRHLWPIYTTTAAQSEKRFDFVFVDGRFRVASFLRALQRVAPRERDQIVLAIHNYNRRWYWVIEEFADRVVPPQEGIFLAVFNR